MATLDEYDYYFLSIAISSLQVYLMTAQNENKTNLIHIYLIFICVVRIKDPKIICSAGNINRGHQGPGMGHVTNN